MSRDIKALISIYTILILIGWNISLKYEVEKENVKKLEAMQVAINLNKANNDLLKAKQYYTILLKDYMEKNK